MRISRAAQLKQYFLRNGYYRVPDETIKDAREKSYKKGYEVRLVAMNYKEYIEIRKLLKSLGFMPGKSFSKGNRRIIPVYGRENFEVFKKLIRETKIRKSTL